MINKLRVVLVVFVVLGCAAWLYQFPLKLNYDFVKECTNVSTLSFLALVALFLAKK